MSFNPAELRAKLQEIKTGKKVQNNVEFLKKFYMPPDFNENQVIRSTMRILPGATNAETNEQSSFYSETSLHKVNGKNLHCPKKLGKPCPICEEIRRLWATENEKNIATARLLKAKKRFYMNVVAREREIINEENKKEIRQNDGPLIYSCGIKVFERVLRSILKEGVGDITDLKAGFDFVVVKEQRGDYPSYDNSEIVARPSEAGTEEETSNWMANLNDLNSLITYKEYNELLEELNIFKGGGTPVSTPAPVAEAAVSEAAKPEPVAKAAVAAPAEEDEAEDTDFLEELERIKANSKK